MSAPVTTVFRSLTPATLLHTVKNNPGMTAKYYAKRYFGDETLPKITSMLWCQLKKFGHVSVVRCSSQNEDETATWYPNDWCGYNIPRVKRYDPSDYDLSWLKRDAPQAPPDETPAPPMPVSPSSNLFIDAVEQNLLKVVEANPNKEMQYYIDSFTDESEKLVAPAAFQRLRQNGALRREQLENGSFVWNSKPKESAA